MHNIDWLHSPALLSTMNRLIERYRRFVDLIAENPYVCIPTLDIDLAWHTHQLHPRSYYIYTEKITTKLVDHDDKIEEGVLSDAFAKTSNLYQARYGEPYSECNCWYCAAIRESHTSSLDRVFNKKKHSALDNVHEDMATDPLKSPHISAHNAVRDASIESASNRKVQQAKLDKEYHKAVARARKNGRKEPTRDEYFYAYAYGYPFMMPMPVYLPYGVDPCLSTNAAIYAAPPAVLPGAGGYGGCAAGTCGSIAAAGGACGGGGGCGGGACGVGAAGGCGGGGGGCGGGGGGGCGGGGC